MSTEETNPPAVVLSTAQLAAPAIAMTRMEFDDGRIGWYIDHPEFYCDIEPDSNGIWCVFFRDKNGLEAFGERVRSNAEVSGPSARPPGYLAAHTEDQVCELIRAADEAKDKRAVDMPDGNSAMRAMHQAYQRLRELGWAEATYSPKDGTVFEVLEAGCVVPGRCHYMGEWPEGGWWMHDAGDLWPSRPILWRKLPDNAMFVAEYAT